MPVLSPQERLGSQIAGKYELRRILGKGGMATVFEGIHLWTQGEVALKLLRPEFAEDPDIVRRFLQEARTASRIRHPNVVSIHDLGVFEKRTVFMVMEKLSGESLGQRLRRETLQLDVTVRLLEPVLDALSAAHEEGIVHRDLKPDNIFLSEESRLGIVPKILDFGIAKVADGPHAGHTATGMAIGTPWYMSPEQILGKKDLGSPADVWSIGVVLFQCLTGRRPHDADSASAAFATIVSESPLPLCEAGPELPEEICDWVDRALSMNPSDRPTMSELRRGLVEAMGWELGALSRSSIPSSFGTGGSSSRDTPGSLPEASTAPLGEATVATPSPTSGGKTRLSGERTIEEPDRHRKAVVGALVIAASLLMGGLGVLAFSRSPEPSPTSPIMDVRPPVTVGATGSDSEEDEVEVNSSPEPEDGAIETQAPQDPVPNQAEPTGGRSEPEEPESNVSATSSSDDSRNGLESGRPGGRHPVINTDEDLRRQPEPPVLPTPPPPNPFEVDL